jgi:hypothetical protein
VLICASIAIGLALAGATLLAQTETTVRESRVVLFDRNTEGKGTTRTETNGAAFADRLPVADPKDFRIRRPCWIEGPSDTILMSFYDSGKIWIASSEDEGRSWRVFSSIEMPARRIAGGYFTRLSNSTLLLRVWPEDTYGRSSPESRRAYWVRSEDDGRTWSDPHLMFCGLYPGEAPIRVMSDGRWAVTPYSEIHSEGGAIEKAAALLLWSEDQGRTWSQPIRFPTPVDGNKGLSEVDVCELGPNSYVAAIRSDEGKGSWDGFYLSWSKDGLDWSVPVSLGERGRMPLFDRVGKLWALTYRLYDHALGIQHSAIRFSPQGEEWSPPIIIEQGVDTAPFLVQIKGRILAFNSRYPERTRITRHDITEKVRQLEIHLGDIPG